MALLLLRKPLVPKSLFLKHPLLELLQLGLLLGLLLRGHL